METQMAWKWGSGNYSTLRQKEQKEEVDHAREEDDDDDFDES